MKKILLILISALFIASLAYAGDIVGKVLKIKGKKVTIIMQSGKVKRGDVVKLVPVVAAEEEEEEEIEGC